MSLYNTYRPKDWDSVIGQEYITTILKNSINTGRTHHAYLFHGSRGTGKTTSARILAKAINCLDQKQGNPCHQCANCKAFENDTLLDIIEIDGASNNGVENVRDLIEKARFEPNQGKYKVYIIDEVHMLSTGAFNALLKTLEQPPEHVKFILATTEIDKVPETIRSRTLRFDFRKIGEEDLIGRMKYVCESEGVTFEPEALAIIAKAARGGFRDALTLLEQNIIDKEVSTAHVRYTLALVEESLIEACIEAMRDHDISTILTLIETLKERHIEARGFLEQIMFRVRDLMVEHIRDDEFGVYSEILEILDGGYGRIRVFPDAFMLVEITLLRVTRRGETSSERVIPAKQTPTVVTSKKSEEKPKTLEVEKQKGDEVPEKKEKESIEKVDVPTEIQEEKRQEAPPAGFSFPTLITHLRGVNPVLSGELKLAQFTIEGTTLKLRFKTEWNYGRVNTPKTKGAIGEALSELFGGNWSVVCELGAVQPNRSIADEVF